MLKGLGMEISISNYFACRFKINSLVEKREAELMDLTKDKLLPFRKFIHLRSRETSDNALLFY